MDIEKLIEQLNDWNEKYISNLCGDRTIKCEEYCIKDDCLIVKAATALSTLQAENEKLRVLVELGNTRAKDYRVMRDRAVKAEAENEKLRTELEQVKKKNKYSAHDVALILSDAFGDSCACNFNGNDEWLTEKCELLDTCPDVVGVACWEQYLKWLGRKED